MNAPVPIINERMRKRRCFADKDLDAAMYEQEKQMEYITSVKKQETIKQGMTKHISLLESRGIPKEVSSQRALLQHLFPNYNQNVLELIWQGSDGNLERAIQQLAHQNISFVPDTRYQYIHISMANLLNGHNVYDNGIARHHLPMCQRIPNRQIMPDILDSPKKSTMENNYSDKNEPESNFKIFDKFDGNYENKQNTEKETMKSTSDTVNHKDKCVKKTPRLKFSVESIIGVENL